MPAGTMKVESFHCQNTELIIKKKHEYLCDACEHHLSIPDLSRRLFRGMIIFGSQDKTVQLQSPFLPFSTRLCDHFGSQHKTMNFRGMIPFHMLPQNCSMVCSFADLTTRLFRGINLSWFYHEIILWYDPLQDLAQDVRKISSFPDLGTLPYKERSFRNLSTRPF